VKVLVCEAGNAEGEVPLGGRWRRRRDFQGGEILSCQLPAVSSRR
jgi:hypothetical protein